MTSSDFDTILIASVMEQSKISFFKTIRKEYNCNKKEFIFGLKDSFERLGEVIFAPHGYHYTDDSLLCEPFHPHGTMNKDLDFSISFILKIGGKSIDVYFTSEDMPYLEKSLKEYFQFISDNEIKKKNAEVTSGSEDNYSQLFEALKPFISGISLPEFSNVIKYKRLTPGTQCAKWIGEKVDACYFADYLKMTNKQWDRCFQFSDSKPLHNKYKDKFDKGSPVKDILIQYLQQ